ncbi:hypothetical protein NE237_017593 [Protea cynaroides]|uniref:Uncharacterized protein n=1 Tax=Protea cynaroides TaxID=273540 RepID=A0A9Q0QND3_9MAGN|nr:hypothetical protein NE237_017593 [Protea cynaroides]
MSHCQHAGREQIDDESDETYLDRNRWTVIAGLVLLFLTGSNGGVLPPAYSSGDGPASSSSTKVARFRFLLPISFLSSLLIPSLLAAASSSPKKQTPSLSGMIEPPSPNEEGLPSSPASSLRFDSIAIRKK